METARDIIEGGEITRPGGSRGVWKRKSCVKIPSSRALRPGILVVSVDMSQAPGDSEASRPPEPGSSEHVRAFMRPGPLRLLLKRGSRTHW